VPSPIAVCVAEEHELFRRGLIASLSTSAAFELCDVRYEAPARDADVVIACDTALLKTTFDCPIVLCTALFDGPRQTRPGNAVAGVLYRATMTEAQLHATVHAVAHGLRVNAEAFDPIDPLLDSRAARVADLLARGCTTREIASDLDYSERTVKKVIQDLEHLLHARNRAQIVAHAMRQGVIC
jgi:DNA-binding CsgD family transcriptional regulator